MIYEPAEDSKLLQKFVKKHAKGKVLDMGTGTGVQAVEASKRAKSVLAVDISQEAIDYCKRHVKSKGIIFKKSDLFSNVATKFDTIVFNPPYLPYDAREPKDSKLATTGGKKGYEVLGRFFSQVDEYLVKNGTILVVFSSLTKKDKVEEIIEDYCLEFRKLESKKIAFEQLYVYQIQKSKMLKKLDKIKNIKKLAKGHRGIVYLGDFKNKKVAIKVEGNTKAINRIVNEVKWLKVLNKKGIGPKLLFSSKDYFVMDYIDGETFWEFSSKSYKNQIRRVIKDVFEQCFTMDQMNLNKEEMHHPVKHILINNSGITMIDFERCRKTLTPKNVTQFCQFLTSGSFAYGLENKGLIISKKILKLAQKYKKEMTKKNFYMILDEI